MTSRRTQICASTHATNLQDALQQSKQAASDGADMLELRLDLLDASFDPDKDLQQLLTGSNLPVIAACRPASHGCAL